MRKPTLFFSQEASRSEIVPSPSSLSFASIPEALEELRHKRAIVLLNGDESDARDLLCAVEHVTPSAPRRELFFQLSVPFAQPLLSKQEDCIVYED